MASPVWSFTELVLSQWRHPCSSAKETRAVDGGSLTIADVVAVSRDLAQVKLTPESIKAMEACSKMIAEKIAEGDVIYGVNTGFGGSADTRSDDVERVQQSLISHLTCGIVADGKQQPVVRLPLNDALAATCMPEAWARASMLIRLNSLAGGASGIRVAIAESLEALLNKDVVPRIPVRGSISASGDLSALAWIGALMQGKPCATAFAGPRHVDGARRVMRADEALSAASIAPIQLHAKEGLAIVNGTAVSAGVAALAAHECLHLAALSQVLTAMSVEALRGTDESFEPFIARVRPHAGQVDSARNIKAFLAGSRLLHRHDDRHDATLRQDRYSLRTASQWIGPVLEDFCLAHHQLTVELNAVTDNPLIDAAAGRVYHGGNFQARAVTSATEKLRQGLQTIGRMLFAQCTEMMNPATSWGLPPNLCSDDANHSFLFKGIDVVVAGLTSELGFLANPVGSHVQTAEMGNQSLNSLALVSARYTLDAVDVLSQLAAAHLLALCQALDLRTIEREGRTDAPPDATPFLGQASRRMYRFIRDELGVPFLGEEHLTSTEAATTDGVTPSIGLYNTRVYESIRSGRLYHVVLESLREVTSLCA
ncbi:Phenylalanine/histidine ammonia-lyase [Ophiobolus disseminans]|uniref:Phenylalanine/histidine ammonia-lyase n=1 Tax=Ophiobolus disseminans TaxID=1469910 RepID=A0A6A6ZGH4_9PLEO|nr:Phenylalanine/histidine ammonia-lyase [Ophiobolus disseminans]